MLDWQAASKQSWSTSLERRDFRLDLIRVTAILLVLLIHSFETCYGDAAWEGSRSAAFSMAFCLGRLGVPMFFMLTGYLVLAKDFSTEDSVRKFYRCSWAPLLLTILLWTTVYSMVFVAAGRATVRDAVRWALLLRDVPAGLWWFVPAIVSLYIAVPFVSRALAGLSPRTLVVPAVFVLAYGFAVPTVIRCAPALGVGGSVSSSVNVSYLFGSYGAYIILGYALRRFGWGSRASEVRPAAAAALALSVALGTALVWRGVRLWYDTLPVATGGVALFVLLLGLCTRGGVSTWLRCALAWASKVSFAVYFLHYIPLLEMQWRGLLPRPGVPAACFLFLALAAGVTVVLGVLWFATSRSPKLRRLVFHVR